MFSSTSGIAPRPLGDDAASALRVMPATGDPTDEVRASLASLTARAQRLVSDRDAEPLLRNGFGLFEASRKGAEAARQQAGRCQSISEGYAPATHASVELFMTQHLGFDTQAQQRLLQQLQHRHAQLGVDLGPMDALPGTEASGFMGIADVDAVVAELKNEILLDVQHAVHRRQTSIVRDQVDALFKAAWHPFYVRVADDYEARSMGVSELAGTVSARKEAGSGVATGTAAGAATAQSLVEVLQSGSAFSTELNQRIAAFATIVDEYAPAQWISHLSAYVAETAMSPTEELAALWASVAELLDAMQRRGSAVSTMAYVASSRRVLERKSLSQLMERVLRLDPLRVEEVENMSASHVLDIIARASGTTNHWTHAFTAMRVGRYDAAKLATDSLGIQSVRDAMAALAAASPAERNTLAPAADVQPVYAEAATREDAHRQAVLLVLLAGRTSESPAAVLRTMLSVAQRATSCLEETLWLRLTCIRGVEESAQVAPVQSLRTLQSAVLEDMQEVVSMTSGNVCRLAAFLIHAGLPSAGLRPLLENNATYVDGFHMALCFNAQNLLQAGLHTALGAPIDMAQHMRRYCSVVLLEVDRRSRAAGFAGAAMFAYFHKSGLTEAFVDCCLKETICTRLLGPRHAVGGQDALLLRSGAGGPLSADLLKALREVAEAASARGEVAKATHVLMGVVLLAMQLGKSAVREQALQRAVQTMAPALAQVLHLPPRSAAVSDVLAQAGQLQRALREQENQMVDDALTAHDFETFEMLCRMADVYVFHAKNSHEDAVAAYLRLPFVPKVGGDVDTSVNACVEAYCGAPAVVQLGARAVLPIAVAAAAQIMHHYGRHRAGTDLDGKGLRLLQCMQLVCEWARQCCTRLSEAYPAVADEFERSYLR